ncbi:MAG: hypothetical protein LBU32_29105 [Clostridiales bacterium]|jgi:hypothetical protein|nr:hypothetical protein [Clostridiales bacterium]
MAQLLCRTNREEEPFSAGDAGRKGIRKIEKVGDGSNPFKQLADSLNSSWSFHASYPLISAPFMTFKHAIASEDEEAEKQWFGMLAALFLEDDLSLLEPGDGLKEILFGSIKASKEMEPNVSNYIGRLKSENPSFKDRIYLFMIAGQPRFVISNDMVVYPAPERAYETGKIKWLNRSGKFTNPVEHLTLTQKMIILERLKVFQDLEEYPSLASAVDKRALSLLAIFEEKLKDAQGPDSLLSDKHSKNNWETLVKATVAAPLLHEIKLVAVRRQYRVDIESSKALMHFASSSFTDYIHDHGSGKPLDCSSLYFEDQEIALFNTRCIWIPLKLDCLESAVTSCSSALMHYEEQKAGWFVQWMKNGFAQIELNCPDEIFSTEFEKILLFYKDMIQVAETPYPIDLDRRTGSFAALNLPPPYESIPKHDNIPISIESTSGIFSDAVLCFTPRAGFSPYQDSDENKKFSRIKLDIGDKCVYALPPIGERTAKALNEGKCVLSEISMNSSSALAQIKASMTVVSDGVFFKYMKTLRDVKNHSDVSFDNLCLWPAISHSSWKIYYTYFKQEDGTLPDVFIKPFEGNDAQIIQSYGENKYWQIASTSFLPRFIFFYKNNAHAGTVIISGNIQEAPMPRGDVSAIVSVDLGTSNSIGCMSIPDEDGKPSIKDLVLPSGRDYFKHIFRSESNAVNRMPHEFVPDTIFTDPANLYITTAEEVFYPEKLKRANASGSVLEIFKDAHISFFEKRVNGRGGAVSSANLKDSNSLAAAPPPLNKLYCDMKWSRDIQMRAVVKLFLEQLMMHYSFIASLKQATSIRWRFTVPYNSKFDLAAYGSEIAEAASKTAQLTGVSSSSQDIFSESFASGIFFAKASGAVSEGSECALDQGYIISDIGGGSTDISVWQNDNMTLSAPKIELSIDLGGRNILRDALERQIKRKRGLISYSEKTFLTGVFASNPAVDTELLRKMLNLEDFTLVFERTISIFGDFIQKTLSGQPDACLSMYTSIKYHISALMYLIGWISYDVLGKGIGQLYRVYFAGNASRIISYLTPDDRLKLQEFFELGSLTDERHETNYQDVSFAVSLRPKSEVAEGVLYLDPSMKLTVRRADKSGEMLSGGALKKATLEVFKGFLDLYADRFPLDWVEQSKLNYAYVKNVDVDVQSVFNEAKFESKYAAFIECVKAFFKKNDKFQ